MATNGFDPTQDYATAYNALKARLGQSYAGQRANLNQELATRGVQTSGVSSIPSSRLGAAQAGEEAGLAGQFALEQARTKISDRQAAEQFARDRELAQLGYERQDALQRRAAKAGLESMLISGGLAAGGAVIGGPAGAAAGYQVGQQVSPAITKYKTGSVKGNYGQY